jgi:hypothetical protein
LLLIAAGAVGQTKSAPDADDPNKFDILAGLVRISIVKIQASNSRQIEFDIYH